MCDKIRYPSLEKTYLPQTALASDKLLSSGPHRLIKRIATTSSGQGIKQSSQLQSCRYGLLRLIR
jgi:hypothetical protein